MKPRPRIRLVSSVLYGDGTMFHRYEQYIPEDRMNLKNLDYKHAIVFVAVVGLTIYAAFRPSAASAVALAVGALGSLLVPSPVAPPDQVADKTTLADVRALKRSLPPPSDEDKTR